MVIRFYGYDAQTDYGGEQMRINLNDSQLILPQEYTKDTIHRIRLYCANRHGSAITDEQAEMLFKAYHRSAYTNEDEIDLGESVKESETVNVFCLPFGFRGMSSRTWGTGFDAEVSSKIVFDTMTQLCGSSVTFIQTNRRIFVWGTMTPYMRGIIKMMIRYFEYVTMNYDTRNDVETNDACLMTMHDKFGLDYVEFFTRLMNEWSILIKDSDYVPVKRKIEKVILNMVNDMMYELYCQEADANNWYRQEYYKKQEEKKKKEAEGVASSNKEMIESMKRIHELIDKTDPEEPVQTETESETDLAQYYDYQTNYDPDKVEETEEKPSLTKTILFHVFVWLMIGVFVLLAILYTAQRLLIILCGVLMLFMYVSLLCMGSKNN